MHDKERGKTMKINEPKTPYVDSLSDVNTIIHPKNSTNLFLGRYQRA